MGHVGSKEKLEASSIGRSMWDEHIRNDSVRKGQFEKNQLRM
jgi:hypothetical protein